MSSNDLRCWRALKPQIYIHTYMLIYEIKQMLNNVLTGTPGWCVSIKGKCKLLLSFMYVCMYIWGFRARQHLRSLAPVMNDDDNDGQMIFGDLGDLKLPDICLTGEEKPRKNLTQETCPDQGLNQGPLHDRCACYHLSHSSGLLSFMVVIARHFK